jgi:glycerate 2-kinase
MMPGSFEPGSLEHDARAIFEAAVSAVGPEAFRLPLQRVAPPPDGGRLFVAALGKASLPLTDLAMQTWGGSVARAVCIVPRGYPATYRRLTHDRLEILEAGHPVPDAGSERAGRRLHDLFRSTTPRDVIVLLLSGGGSALSAWFAGEISLADGRQTTDLLLRSGGSIHEVNTVRKHITRIAGGQLAVSARARVHTFAMSDVPGDVPSVIASGPTFPDQSTFEEALAIIDRLVGREALPASVLERLQAGAHRLLPDTPDTGHPAFERCTFEIVASNQKAVEAACSCARRLGYEAGVVPDILTGEARLAGPAFVAALRDLGSDGPCCLVTGGETTVTVQGSGRGGRNQEVALAAGMALHASAADGLVLCGGTDGIDGPTDAAGAWCDARGIEKAGRLGLDASVYLANNDAYTFFESLGQLLMTGPTHTNVMDVAVALRT